MRTLKQPLTVAVTATLTSLGFGQDVLYDFDGDSLGDRLGWAIAFVGDVNNDGLCDIAGGAPRDDNNGTSSGSARVWSGLDGSVLYTFDGTSTSDQFGSSLAGAGDVDFDGFDDIIVGAPFDDDNGTNSGSARVLSGIDGSVLFELFGDTASDEFGESVAGIGDLNGDDHSEFAVGAPQPNTNGAGYVRVFSGIDGCLLFQLDGDMAQQQFGVSVASAGDTNGDTVPDIVVGAWLDSTIDTSAGKAVVYSGVQGAALRTFFGDSAFDFFGFSVAGAGDVDADGFDDVVVGAYLDDPNGGESGSAAVYSGCDGQRLHAWAGDAANDQFGWSVHGAGDVDLDGHDDVIIGAPFPGGGYARVHSGRTSEVLFTMLGDAAGDTFARSVSGGGDVDGDGLSDFAAGAPLDDDSATSAGRVRVFVGDCTATTYCTAKLNSAGCVPSIATAAGSPSLTAATSFQVSASMVLNNKAGLLFYGTTARAALPFLGGTLCTQPPLRRTPLSFSFGNPPPDDCSGSYSFDLNAWIQAGNDPSITLGSVVQAQFWTRDPAVSDGTGIGLTDAAEMSVCD